MVNKKYTNNSAVSPVVGVMLMLVVVIIIAAVVSGFAGSLVSGEKKTPSAAIETHIVNTGMFTGSGITLAVKSVSEPIPSKDVKIVTSWSTTCKLTIADDPGNPAGSCTNVGDRINGGGNATYGIGNTRFSTATVWHTVPYGYGPGVTRSGIWNEAPSVVEGLYGNYTLTGGTDLRAYPVGPFVSALGPAGGGYSAPPGGPVTPTYKYFVGNLAMGGRLWNIGQYDAMQGLLGLGWENLRAGDVVNVKMIHIPSGKAIYDADVAVEG
ncbi:MAG: type IV pilin, partial [Methanoregula sp.]|nr:type IV pilin [Methanoregula sp.]